MVKLSLPVFLALLRPSGDRDRDRLRRLFLTAAASLLSRLGSMIVLLVTVPMALRHLGPERFGMWMILSSLAAIAAFADFGIGNGVLNLVAAAFGKDDDCAIREIASSATAMLSAIGAAVAAASVSAYLIVDWGTLFGVTSSLARAEAGTCVLIFGISLAVGIPLSVANKVQLGLQQGYAANLWVGVGGILTLVTVVAAIRLNASTPVMVLALFGSQQAAMLLNSLYFFCLRRPEFAPRLRLVRSLQARSLLGLGTGFFLLQLVGVITFRIDALIVANLFGSVEAGAYAVYERIFSLVTMIVNVTLMPLWPAYGEAAARGDRTWVAKTFNKSLIFSLCLTASVCAVLVLFHQSLVHLWTGRVIGIPEMLVLGFAMWKVMEAFGTAVAALLNGMSTLRGQVISAAALGVVGLSLKLSLAKTLGISALPWLTMLAYTFTAAIPQFLMARNAIRSL